MFFQVDDKYHENPKVMAMIEAEGFARAAVAGFLWTLSGSLCRSARLDGAITLGQAAKATMDRAAAKRGADLLVKYGLWHAPGHACDVCPQPPTNGWVFHDWFQFNYGTAAAEKIAVAKRKELRNEAIVEAVWARDTRIDGHPYCRYCARKVARKQGRGGDRRSVLVGTLDHVDPARAIGATNIVVACSECNQTKSQRLPEQAGMTLLPAPDRTPPTPAGSIHGSTPINAETNTAINPESIREVSPPRARAGGHVGGTGVGPGVGLGSADGPEGHAVGPAGAGRAGPAPAVPVASPLGSPWEGHHGRPPSEDLIVEATCAEHGLPMPCRKCRPGGGA